MHVWVKVEPFLLLFFLNILSNDVNKKATLRVGTEPMRTFSMGWFDNDVDDTYRAHGLAKQH